MTASYDRETQIEDLAAITAAEGILSARVAGEAKLDLKPSMHVYARIAGYSTPNHGKVKTVARMFWALTQNSSISGFDLKAYETLLSDVRKQVKAKLIRRRPATKKCALPNVHRQPCFCARLAVAQHIERERASFSAVGEGAQAPILPIQTEGRTE